MAHAKRFSQIPMSKCMRDLCKEEDYSFLTGLEKQDLEEECTQQDSERLEKLEERVHRRQKREQEHQEKQRELEQQQKHHSVSLSRAHRPAPSDLHRQANCA
nr:U2 small nuclear ribonucleoprotein auxiliary factor 35 kDa subunit-related protein 1-like isoform X2 [Danio rerio]|eukprot:XP_021330578.1 U2 small nuclear ribonucleoprotein auxiliary factor 35 kDa subunit-related protein 1-like isoform X2 [Danio rerio]